MGEVKCVTLSTDELIDYKQVCNLSSVNYKTLSANELIDYQWVRSLSASIVGCKILSADELTDIQWVHNLCSVALNECKGWVQDFECGRTHWVSMSS